MLSIIVASDRDINFRRLEQSIAGTVGAPYELLRVEDINKGLSACYNRGAASARFPYLCFVHDDVIFHTQDWGEKITALLQAKGTGVVGCMGGRYKSAFGLSWRDGRTTSFRYQLKDGLENGKLLQYLPNNSNVAEVLCLDGAFFCCRKEVWERFWFDDSSFKGFHFYDIDFSFRVSKELKNFVTGSVLIEHFSHGNFSTAFLSDSLRFDQKHAVNLPTSLDPISPQERKQLEGYALSEKLRLMKKNAFPVAARWRLLKHYLRSNFNLYQALRNIVFGFIK